MEESLKNLKISGEMHRRLSVYKAERGGTLQELVESWIEQGMSGGELADPVLEDYRNLSPANRALVAKTIRVLRDEKKDQLYADVAKILRGTLGLLKDF